MTSITTESYLPSEIDFLETNLDDDSNDSIDLKEETTESILPEENVALYIESTKGKPCLLLNGYKYRKVYNTKYGTRWNCSKNNKCLAYLCMNDKNEITKCNEVHNHPVRWSDASDPKVDVAVISNLGTILELNGYVYKKTEEFSTDGTRWVCSVEKCHAFLIMNEDDEIISAKELHSHAAKKKWKMTTINDKSKGELVTSRNGNQNLMYRRFAYRKKYTRGDKIRWVCATMKYCRACLHTNESLLVLKAYQEHCHAPPKYNYK